jgi:hypothetical protein
MVCFALVVSTWAQEETTSHPWILTKALFVHVEQLSLAGYSLGMRTNASHIG